MHTKDIEKAAYTAAHRILAANTLAPGLVCPGARRSYAVDTIADIIREAFEGHGKQSGDQRSIATQSGPYLVNRRRPVRVEELPVRASL